MKFVIISCLLVYSCLYNQCSTSQSTIEVVPKKVQLKGVPYNIHDFDEVIVLPSELREVSGLSYDEGSKSLLCVNDELGFIYGVDLKEGLIQTKRKFGDIGDYEGLSHFKDDLVVARSNGKIYFYNPKDDNVYKIVLTPLSNQNNIEGIIYDAQAHKILIACKGKPRIAGKFNETKGKIICEYDIEADTLMSDPYLLIKDKQLKRKVKEIYSQTGLDEIHLQQLEDRVESFAPSGLAIHPLSGDLYVLSAQRSLLVVFNQQKQLQHIHFLAEDVHIQPEGITFTPTGDMYIANEGKTGRAKIFYYKYQL